MLQDGDDLRFPKQPFYLFCACRLTTLIFYHDPGGGATGLTAQFLFTFVMFVIYYPQQLSYWRAYSAVH